MLLDLKLLLDHDISNCKSSKQILKVKKGKQTYCQAIKGIRHEVKIELVKQLVIKKNSTVDVAEMMKIAHKHQAKRKVINEFECESVKDFTNKWGVTFGSDQEPISYDPSIVSRPDQNIEKKIKKMKINRDHSKLPAWSDGKSFVTFFKNRILQEQWDRTAKVVHEEPDWSMEDRRSS
jgi:hypothetical protein